jgi:hypothetical protein
VRPGSLDTWLPISRAIVALVSRTLDPLKVLGISKKEITALGTAGVRHLHGDLLGQICHRGVHIDNLVVDQPHLEQIIDGKKDNRNKNQPYDGQAISHSTSQRTARAKIVNDLRSPSVTTHLLPQEFVLAIQCIVCQ